jgi:hypothetical protein
VTTGGELVHGLVAEVLLVEELLPSLEPPAVPGPPQQIVDTPDDRCTLVKNVSRCEAEPLPIILDQIPLPSQISLMHFRFR